MKFCILAVVVGLTFVQSVRAEGRSPVLVQLFTSEGCSSCPPADKLLSELASPEAIKGVTIIPMSMHVDYWNQLGWRDPFSLAQFSGLQQDYQRILKNDALYTPQMIVDGRSEFVGSDRSAAEKAITAAASAAKVDPVIQVNAAKDLSVINLKIDLQSRQSVPPNESCRLVVAITEDDLSSAVRQGENAGRQLHHTAVVRLMETVADIASVGASKPIEKQLKLNPSWKRQNLHVIAFVQSTDNLRVYGAATVPVPD